MTDPLGKENTLVKHPQKNKPKMWPILLTRLDKVRQGRWVSITKILKD